MQKVSKVNNINCKYCLTSPPPQRNSVMKDFGIEGGEQMKRHVLSLIVMLWIVLSIPLMVHAATPRAGVISPTLTFSGSTATCSVVIVSDSDQITATITLKKNTLSIATWNVSGIGFINFTEHAVVPSKGEYTLTVDSTINGVKQTQASTTTTYK